MEVEEQWFKAILIPSLRILEKLSNWDTPDDVNLIIWALDFIFFFLSFCLSSPTIDVDFIDCKKNLVRLLQLRGDDEKLPYWEIKYSMMQSERQHRKNLFIDILFYLSWLWFIFSTSLSYYASIHSRWISLLGYLMRFYAKEWNSCADF